MPTEIAVTPLDITVESCNALFTQSRNFQPGTKTMVSKDMTANPSLKKEKITAVTVTGQGFSMVCENSEANASVKYELTYSRPTNTISIVFTNRHGNEDYESTPSISYDSINRSTLTINDGNMVPPRAFDHSNRYQESRKQDIVTSRFLNEKEIRHILTQVNRIFVQELPPLIGLFKPLDCVNVPVDTQHADSRMHHFFKEELPSTTAALAQMKDAAGKILPQGETAETAVQLSASVTNAPKF